MSSSDACHRNILAMTGGHGRACKMFVSSSLITIPRGRIDEVLQFFEGGPHPSGWVEAWPTIEKHVTPRARATMPNLAVLDSTGTNVLTDSRRTNSAYCVPLLKVTQGHQN